MSKKTDTIEMSWILEAKPKDVYEHWLNSKKHAAMTGGAAEIDGKVGGKFKAWDGYISGVTKKLEKNKRIVQTWRTAQFPKKAPDSRIDVTLKALKGKTQLTLRHTGLQPGDGAKYTTGWYDFYLKPMTAYFGKK